LASTRWSRVRPENLTSHAISQKQACESAYNPAHTATHLLRAGVDINTIRAWLGHVSRNTTNVYAEVDLEMKAKVLAAYEIKTVKEQKHWRADPGLLRFLQALVVWLCGVQVLKRSEYGCPHY
jgi:Phage integrase family